MSASKERLLSILVLLNLSIFFIKEISIADPLDIRVEVAPTAKAESSVDSLYKKQSSNSFFEQAKKPVAQATNTPEVRTQSVQSGCGVFEVTLGPGQIQGMDASGRKVVSGPGSTLPCVKEIVKSCQTIRNFANYKNLPQWEWKQNLKDFGSENAAVTCDERAAGELRQLGAYSNTNRTRLFNRQCEPVENPKAKSCGKLTVRMLGSPISLIFNEEKAFSEITLTQFPLRHGINNKWYTWRGSEHMPLLVYNPENKSTINEAASLFGDWTFGGKINAGLNISSPPSKWRDGYEALGFLDVNFDQEISGEELNPLSLWFDKNRDGISQEGEIKHILDLNITKLFYKNTKKSSSSNDIFAEIGFERNIEGKTIIGRSVDWYGEEFSSKFEAMRVLAARNSLNFQDTEYTDYKSANSDQGVDGVWIWEIDGKTTDDKLSYLKPKGMLMLRIDEDKITGSTVTEIPVTNAGDAHSMITGYSLTGTYKKLPDGFTEIEFSVLSDTKKLRSKARISKDGKTIRGITEDNLIDETGSQLKVKYSWTAERFM